MDRRSFLQSLAAIGLLPAADIPRLLRAPEAQEPSAAELVVDGLLLHPLAITMRHEPIEVTGYGDEVRHYVAGRVSFDLDLTEAEYALVAGRFGKELVLDLVVPHWRTPAGCGKVVLTHHGYSDNVWAGGRRFYATFERVG